jgi:hypothetical protein
MRQMFSLDLSGTDLDQAVAARLERQQALSDTGKRFTFVMTEAVLRWRFCPDEVMAAQVAYIASVAEVETVRIGIVPFSARAADIPLHGYEIFDERLVNIGLEHAAVAVTDPHDVRVYLRLFGVMSDAAEFGAQARARLVTVASDYRR